MISSTWPSWLRASVAAGALASIAACDPSQDPAATDNGPPFLIVGLASQQPSSPELGVTAYVQARGGNYVGILTHGCTHTLGSLADVQSSCAYLPVSTDPLYFVLQPGDEECVVEARLYSICDDAAPIAAGESLYSYCDLNGTLVTSVVVPIAPPVPGATLPDGATDLFDDDGAAGDAATGAM